MSDKLILVDGNSIATAAYFGIPKLTTNDGIPTNAVYGFINSIFRLMDDFPSHFGVVFDKGRSHRKAASETYKQHRKTMDDTLKVQYPIIKQFLDLMKIPHFAKEGYEGDDILSIFTHKFHSQIPIYIVTRDRDLYQLCAYPNTYIIFTAMVKGKAITKIIDREAVKQTLGIEPEQLVYFKALAGDKSDEIPGVRGIGGKTAVKLIQDHGDLDRIVSLAKEGKLKPPRLNTLITRDLDNLKESFELGKLIVRDTPVGLEVFKRTPANEENIKYFFKRYEFNSFLGS